jgi:hypothetical protein
LHRWPAHECGRRVAPCATGGGNLARHLVVQGFNTNIDHTVNFAAVPSDSAAKRLMIEVHFYDPYNFTLNENSTIWQWGTAATNASATEIWANEAFVDAQFQKMKSRFVDAGIPVILGEFGVIRRTEYSGSEPSASTGPATSRARPGRMALFPSGGTPPHPAPTTAWACSTATPACRPIPA